MHMADKLDHLLSDYFTGKLDVAIQLRLMELTYRHGTPDENIGGGRKQNDYNNAVESKMIHEQNDPELKRLRYQKSVIKMMFDCLIKSHQDVLIDKYGNKKSWVTIGIDNHIDERTAREWRDDFKEGIKGYLYTTFDIATRFRPVYAPV